MWLPLTHPPSRNLVCNPGLCLDWESNWGPFGSQASTQSTEPHQPGWATLFLIQHEGCKATEIMGIIPAMHMAPKCGARGGLPGPRAQLLGTDCLPSEKATTTSGSKGSGPSWVGDMWVRLQDSQEGARLRRQRRHAVCRELTFQGKEAGDEHANKTC